MANSKQSKLDTPRNAASCGVDPVMLRAQKLGLVAISEDPDNPAAAWIIGVVHLIDAVQDALAETYGEQDVFGPLEQDGVPGGVDWCSYCGLPIALDVTAGGAITAGVWIDATGDDICAVETHVGAGDGGQHSHMPSHP